MEPDKPKTPVFFITHGAPDVLLSSPETAQTWYQQAGSFSAPDAIVMISAHWETASFSVSGNKDQSTVYDFRGFSPELYEYKYPSPVGTKLAEELHDSLGLNIDHQRGLDHGAWVPLVAMYPEHDIPVVLLSVAPRQGVRAHFELGQKLAALRERNILIIGSGAIIHNLGQLNWRDPSAGPDVWATDFVEKVLMAVEKRDWELLIRSEMLNDFQMAHPSNEHFLPLLVAAGAAEDANTSIFSDFWCYGNLGMQSIKFE